MKPQAVFLDAATLGEDISLQPLHRAAEITIHQTTPEAEVLERCRGASVVVTNKIRFDRHRLQSLSQTLRLICLTATGYDNIDITAAREFGITVCNVRDYSTDSVAQHTLAITLSLLQHITYYAEFTASGSYSAAPAFTHFGRPWFELANKTWGIIGMGAIGRKTAAIAAALGCRVLYYSSSGQDREPRFERVELAELLQRSQVVSIHAPRTERTSGLIAAAELAQMQSDAILVNVGRGGIVDEAALATALQAGEIRGAALDVFVDEPLLPDSPLLGIDRSRLLLTPHVAWGSIEARSRVVAGVADNILAFQRGTPENTVG
ncbi:NAD(P)-dependent oxidoreductase [Spirochaeta africana]|uniref:Lactate dehydrogenase-like oxidoreductase n=1 Tax=Spirochaeta africana (strain ATCC 700263 / DSM 8902 / Z-7692) TaxID=889378 RepID=H9UMK3_SPIAZ|nr:NAD(P)-dependent oxidoreductase [Spirochaeta africana]AFG38746.1 lactate dehydrogenase-like oxidoreductase [Spirochaeta africana DSM 8902]